MDEFLSRVWIDLIGRISGPMSFRLLMQPTMAMIFAIRDGLRDAKAGRPLYTYTVFTDANQRRSLLRDGWRSVGKVFILAILLDCVYQFIVLRWIYPGEALIVAFLLACVPYLLLRGVVNRLARKFIKADLRTSAGDQEAPNQNQAS